MAIEPKQFKVPPSTAEHRAEQYLLFQQLLSETATLTRNYLALGLAVPCVLGALEHVKLAAAHSFMAKAPAEGGPSESFSA